MVFVLLLDLVRDGMWHLGFQSQTFTWGAINIAA
jgi:hypothetical protein